MYPDLCCPRQNTRDLSLVWSAFFVDTQLVAGAPDQNKGRFRESWILDPHRRWPTIVQVQDALGTRASVVSNVNVSWVQLCIARPLLSANHPLD